MLCECEEVIAMPGETVVNSVLVGGHSAGLYMVIPKGKHWWSVAISTPIPMVLYDSNAPLPLEYERSELYEERGKSLQGLRRFVCVDD